MTEEIKKIQAKPLDGKDIGVDQDNSLLNNILNAVQNSILDISALDSFTNVTQSREQVYELLDQMVQDSTISSVLETYTEDVCETNDSGKIVWCESNDTDVSRYVNYLLDVMNVDKNCYNWVYNLIKYGDLYLRLYRESDYNDDIFSNNNKENDKQFLNENLNDDDFNLLSDELVKQQLNEEEKDTLNEDVKVKMHNKNDHYVHYLEAVTNPGQMFELTKFGKTMGYIDAPTYMSSRLDNTIYNSLMRYRVNKKDVVIYEPTDFVHAVLNDNTSRTPEEVSIFLDSKEESNYNYKVKRGQSLLYNTFKIWRQLLLLENSVLLNRLTKSSIVRVIGVEVGDMPKEQIGPHLTSIKSMVEQKSAIDTNKSMQEYTNPSPIANNIYVPTHGGVGAITTQQIGGDVDIKSLADLEYYRDKLFASVRVPKQYFGFTDDGAGFNGGTSLSIISSRYGKTVKRVQNTICQAITDAINLMLIDAGLKSYINKFTIRMQAPVTQEELDRRENLSNRIRVVGDIMQNLDGIKNNTIKLKILKSLMASAVTDSSVLDLIQEEIDALEEKGKKKKDKEPSDEEDIEDDIDLNDTDFDGFNEEIGTAGDLGLNFSNEQPSEVDVDNVTTEPQEINLPTPEELEG